MTSAITTNTALLAPHTPSTAAAKMPLVLRLRPALNLSNSITNFSTKHNHAISSFTSCSFAARFSTPWLRNTVKATATATGNVWCTSGRGLRIRCKVTRSGESGYSPLSSSKSSANWSDRPPTEMAPLFPGCDYEHWLIVMDPPNGGNATKEEMIDYYIKTLAKVLGSEEAAKKSIYNVSCERYYGFGCQIDEETSTKLEGLPGVCFVLPDSYVDVENKDYGAELLVDGKIVERSPERQRRVTPQPQRNNSDRPRYNDRTRYVRRRENQSQGR